LTMELIEKLFRGIHLNFMVTMREIKSSDGHACIYHLHQCFLVPTGGSSRAFTISMLTQWCR
jgi:hypothetical protein